MTRKGRAMEGSVAQFEALSGHLTRKSTYNQKMSLYKQDQGTVVGMETRIRDRRTGIRSPVGTRLLSLPKGRYCL